MNVVPHFSNCGYASVDLGVSITDSIAHLKITLCFGIYWINEIVNDVGQVDNGDAMPFADRGRKSRGLLIQWSMQVSDNINVWHTLSRRRCWTSMEINNFNVKNYYKPRHDVLNIKCLPYIYLSQSISPYFKSLQFNSVVSLCATQCAVYQCRTIISRSRKISWPTNGPYS